MSLPAVELYLSPSGADENEGAKSTPLATLPAARDMVRELRAKGEKGDIDVILSGGTYTLTETLSFGLEDSAPEGAATRYRAADGETPLISGGRRITDWKKTALQGGKVWTAEVPWAKGEEFFHCLYDGETLLQRAQSETILVDGSLRGRYAGPLKERINFSYQGNVLKPWENLDEVELFGAPTRAWLRNFLSVESVNPEKKTAVLAVPATYRMSGEWVVENHLDHLDTAGEWALNGGVLYYWPESGTPGVNIIAPALNELIRVEGSNDASLAGKNDVPVKGIVFKGLTLSYADRQRWLPEDIGIQHDWNMWDKANGLIRFRGAEDCLVKGCTFTNSGSDGLRMDLYCQKITVEDSTFKDLGGVGVQLSGYGPGKKDVNKHNTVHNNEITRVGAIFLHSPGIFIWQSGHNQITNNHIYDQAYTGVVVAGVRRRFFAPTFSKMGEKRNPFKNWSFPEGTREHIPTIRWDEITLDSVKDWSAYEPYMHARENVIAYNEVHDCLKLLHDGNCIYLSANGNGNKVQYNVTYNHPQGAMIRTDDDSHGCTVNNNLLFGTQNDQGICIKGLNTSQHNVNINATMGTGGAGNTVHSDSEMSKNVFYFTASTPAQNFHRKIERVEAGLDHNLYYHENGSAEKALKEQRKKGKAKIDMNSVAGDPMFVDLKHGDFSYKAGSPALALGIEPMTHEIVSKMGTTRDPFLKRFLTSSLLQANHSGADHAKEMKE